MKQVKVGIIGFGTIGAGVVKALQSKRAFLRAKTGIDVSLAAICDKDLKTKRSVRVNKALLTKSIGKILYDPEIDIVVELVGGVHPAKDFVMEALRQGKHVVTANKALLSEHGAEIFNLANDLNLCVGFEASVGGGIPIIRVLKEGFIANRIELIYGIINGTSNFILSLMARGGHSFTDALAIAQEKGYAEKDPTLDISGKDSAHKLSVLTLLGFGIHVKPDRIYTEGIGDIEVRDIQYAHEMGYEIKLLSIAKRSGRFVDLRVHPTLISREHLLASVHGVYNAIFVKGDLAGDNLFYGKGAGAHPTSSAVVSDIIAIAKCINTGGQIQRCVTYTKDVDDIKKIDDVRTRHYIRFSAIDKPGVLAKVSGILGKYNISIASVTQKERREEKAVPIVMMTHEARERDMAQAMSEIGKMHAMRCKPVRVRVEG